MDNELFEPPFVGTRVAKGIPLQLVLAGGALYPPTNFDALT